MDEPVVSVIVPTLNEEGTISRTLQDLGGSREVLEVIVVDGGSRDRTGALARSGATRFLVEPGGLALQLNAGARAARGDVLLFHPADLQLPESGLREIRRILANPRVVGGAFRLGFASPRPIYRLIALLANLRNLFGFGPFGDQAIFARRGTFEELGGFSPGAVLEDLDLVKRLRRAGRFVILPSPVRSSVRRYEEGGVLNIFAAHFWSGLLYLLGFRERARALKGRLQKVRSTEDDGGGTP